MGQTFGRRPDPVAPRRGPIELRRVWPLAAPVIAEFGRLELGLLPSKALSRGPAEVRLEIIWKAGGLLLHPKGVFLGGKGVNFFRGLGNFFIGGRDVTRCHALSAAVTLCPRDIA